MQGSAPPFLDSVRVFSILWLLRSVLISGYEFKSALCNNTQIPCKSNLNTDFLNFSNTHEY